MTWEWKFVGILRQKDRGFEGNKGSDTVLSEVMKCRCKMMMCGGRNMKHVMVLCWPSSLLFLGEGALFPRAL